MTTQMEQTGQYSQARAASSRSHTNQRVAGQHPMMAALVGMVALLWAVSAQAAHHGGTGETNATEASAAGASAAGGRDAAIERVVREAPRTEAGGHDLHRRGLYPEALMVWEEAADLGDAGAAYRVGATYMDGQAVYRNYETGIKWLRRAADAGDARAMTDLGSAYDWGFGVEQDRAQAAKWFEQGAIRGNAASQYNLGVLYEDGDGVQQDLVKAYMYYILANQNGFPRYPAEAIEQLTPRLTNDQIKRGVDAARAFEPI